MTAGDFLRSALANGPKLLSQLVSEGAALGVTARAIKRAADDQVPIARHKQRIPGKAGSESVWSLGPGAAPASAAAGQNGGVGLSPTVPGALRTPYTIAELSRMIEQLRVAGQTIGIWRVVPGMPTPAYVTSVVASDFSLGWLKRALGGGRFIVQGVPGEIGIEGPPKQYVEPGDYGAPVPAALPAAAPASDINDKLFALVLKQLEVSSVRQTTDPLEMALKIVTLMRAAPVEAAKPNDLLAMVKQLQELGIDIGMGGDRERSEPSMVEVAASFAPAVNAIAGVITKAQQKLGASGVAGVPPTGAAPVPLAIPPDQFEGLAPMASDGTRTPVFPADPHGYGMVARELYPHLGTINMQARSGTEPPSVAKYILDSVSSKVYATIDAAVEGGDLVGSVVALLAPHLPAELLPWYSRLAQAVQDDIFADRRAAEAEDRVRGGER